MEAYAIVALIVIVFWLGGFMFYLVTSNRQRDIEAEIAQIDSVLDAEEAGKGVR